MRSGEAHTRGGLYRRFSIGEHPTLSLPATVNLADLFVSAHMKIVSATAMSLTGNQPIEVRPHTPGRSVRRAAPRR